MPSSQAASPHPIMDPSRIPARRYCDRAFFEAEREHLWPHAWQMACRLEEIPEIGDYAEYTVLDQSILVVRHGAGPGGIKAFHNVCPHRATQIASGAGSFRSGQITCPFHGWRWTLDGSSSFVYAGRTFRPDCVIKSDLALRECLVDTWGGCVFINLDRSARPLRDALEPMPGLLDPLAIADMRVRWWKGVRLKANWKLAQEAFLEGFHVMQTHPQLTGGRPDRYPHDAFEHFSHPNGHSHFQGKPGEMPGIDPDDVVGSTVDYLRILSETLDAYPLARDVHILEGLRHTVADPAKFNSAFMARLYEHYAGAGMPLPQLSSEGFARWGGVFFIFPNYFVLPMFGSALLYRSRPDGLDPEACLFELWAVTLKPAHEPVERARFAGVFDKEDEAAWPLIPRQDFSNIERQQRGLHSRAFEALRLSTRYEQGITNMHRELDRYLAG
jgi:phenylpropionate dioxygenase-like ring-hydroxylating dioxygenase large terminal subunit